HRDRRAKPGNHEGSDPESARDIEGIVPMKLICSTCAVLFVLIAGAYALAQTASSTPGSTFRDCVDCPQMVVVPAGRFTMGVVSREEEREGLPDNLRGRSVPQHSVAIRQAFAVGKYDVTREEYEMFAAATNRADADSCYTLNSAGQFVQTKGPGWRNPGFTQTSRDPVVCVSWDDAQAYLAWLSQKT